MGANLHACVFVFWMESCLSAAEPRTISGFSHGPRGFALMPYKHTPSHACARWCRAVSSFASVFFFYFLFYFYESFVVVGIRAELCPALAVLIMSLLKKGGDGDGGWGLEGGSYPHFPCQNTL